MMDWTGSARLCRRRNKDFVLCIRRKSIKDDFFSLGNLKKKNERFLFFYFVLIFKKKGKLTKIKFRFKI